MPRRNAEDLIPCMLNKSQCPDDLKQSTLKMTPSEKMQTDIFFFFFWSFLGGRCISLVYKHTILNNGFYSHHCIFFFFALTQQP